MTEAVQEQSFDDAFDEFAEDKNSEHITDTLAAEAASDVQHQATSEQTMQAESPEVAASAATNSESAQQGLTPEQLEHQIKSEKGRTAALKRKNAEALAQLDLLKQQNAALLAQQVPDLPSLGDDADLAPNIAAFVSAQHAAQKQLHQTNLDNNQQQISVAEQRATAIAADYVEELVPGWLEDVKKPEYQAWVASQPRGIQAMSANSKDPDDVVFLVTQFRNAVNPQAAKVADTVQQRQARLLNAVSPKSAARPAVGGTSIPDDFDGAFEHFAAKRR